MDLNKHFRIVFTPKSKDVSRSKYDRFIVSANRLADYVTEKNAQVAFKRLNKSKAYKTTIQFRKFGKLEIYSK
jgi:hypothetical protein